MLTRLLIPALALSIANTAQAEPIDDGAITVTVKVSDLNRDDPADRAELLRRVDAAARSACMTGGRENWVRQFEQRCIEEAKAATLK